MDVRAFIEKAIGPGKCCGATAGGAVLFRDGAMMPARQDDVRCATCSRAYERVDGAWRKK